MALLPLRLPPGADLRRALEEAAHGGRFDSAFVLSGIGSLSTARVRYAGEAAESVLEGPLEILSLAGSLSAAGAHLHVTVSDAAGVVRGGHLGHGSVVGTTAELLLAPLPAGTLTRVHDPATGYLELLVNTRPPSP